MQKLFFLILSALPLTGCGTAREMICLIDQSTEAIHANREAIEYDTMLINENARVVHESTLMLKENERHLKTLSH